MLILYTEILFRFYDPKFKCNYFIVTTKYTTLRKNEIIKNIIKKRVGNNLLYQFKNYKLNLKETYF